MRVLAGDIGGTKVLLQLAELERDNTYRLLAEQRFESASYAGLLPIVREFLAAAGAASPPEAACFGIAGPITETRDGPTARVTNLPWVVAAVPLAQELGFARLRLINDFQAVAYGIEVLTPDDLQLLQPGLAVPRAPRAVIGAGTGLGQALAVWQGGYYHAIPTEGGHVDFAPTDELQVHLLQYLAERYGRVSYERVLSGPGIANLYAFFAARGEAANAQLLRGDPDAPAAITQAALRGDDPAASAALRLFAKIYGAHCGNVALSYFAAGGVYVAGGIAPKVISFLQDGTFMRAFGDKGRMSALLATMPVYVVTNERVGLLGAALAASRL